jgi:hypothetical protein
MEDFWCQVEFGYLRCGYFNSGGVRSLRKFCLDLETGSGLGVAYQVNHGLIADQRSCPPILRDEREHPVFDLVPLAGSGRKMRYMQMQAGEIGQPL